MSGSVYAKVLKMVLSDIFFFYFDGLLSIFYQVHLRNLGDIIFKYLSYILKTLHLLWLSSPMQLEQFQLKS